MASITRSEFNKLVASYKASRTTLVNAIHRGSPMLEAYWRGYKRDGDALMPHTRNQRSLGAEMSRLHYATEYAKTGRESGYENFAIAAEDLLS